MLQPYRSFTNESENMAGMIGEGINVNKWQVFGKGADVNTWQIRDWCGYLAGP